MLAQLRLQYPQGCLVSELLDIKHGKYIVKASVQVEGVTLATGMGSAETVEIAEDRARQRALDLLNLDFTLGHSAATKGTTVDSLPTPSPIAPLIQEAKIQEAKVQEILVQEVKSPEVKVPEVQRLEAIAPRPVANPIPPVPEKIPQLEETKVPSSEKVIPLHIVPEIQPSDMVNHYPVAVAAPSLETNIQPIPSIQPRDFLPAKEEERSKPKATSEPIPDIKDVMARTEIEIRRLGWTTQQGRNFLLQRYGKRARTLLSDEELLDFLDYLEGQAKPS